jgi:CheY-like chemotaxis protein
MMDTGIPELNAIGEQLMSLERPKKPKMLVVDDEPDNLDLLYRTFRREFNVLRAESGVSALEVLATEGEVAVIISDQRMPEMKGTEFLSKTVPQFPDTMRIILTGFTDVEDLVDAINSGQVYKYITKPWDPNELKTVVQRAVETYEFYKYRTENLRWAQAQTRLLDKIVQVTRQPVPLETILKELAIALLETFSADACIIQMTVNGQLSKTSGQAQAVGVIPLPLSQEPKAQEAIVTQASQLAVYEEVPDAPLRINLVLPAIFQGKVLGLVSLQWKTSHSLQQDELTLLYLSVQHIALTLACLDLTGITAE